MKRKLLIKGLGVMMLSGALLASCSISKKQDNINKTEEDDTTNTNIVTGDYVVSYYVNGTLYKNVGVSSGESLELIETPVIEGYDVTWENVDLTNIKKNITINAILTAKEYNITYILKDADGNEQEYKKETYKYGAEIVSPTVSVDDGYVFSGWISLPSTMGASDLVVTGSIVAVSDTYDISLFSSGSNISITKAGAYKITGTNTNVSFTASNDVLLVLDNVVDTSLETSFITGSKAVQLSLVGENVLSNTSLDTTDGVINMTSDLEILGEGTLNITSSNASGAGIMVTKATAKISSGTIIINSAGNGIQAKKAGGNITIDGGLTTITSASAALKAKNSILVSSGTIALTTTAGDGFNADNVSIDGGNITIISKQDGIQGDTLVSITSGTINITSNGGTSGNASLTTSSNYQFEVADTSAFTTNDEYYGLYYLSGTKYVEIDSTNVSTYKSQTLYDKVGCKGIKSDTDINISGGNITINSLDDSIHSKTNVTISGGVFDIDSKSDGISADTLLSISGGTFDIYTKGTFYQVSDGSYRLSGSTYIKAENGSYDMYSSAKGLKSDVTIKISGGNITATTDDDAIHSDDYILITSGTFNLTTLDDGVHADTTLDVGVEGASNSLIDLNVLKAYEGMESGTLNYYSGTVSIYATDDGINAGGGTSGATTGDTFNPGGGRPGGFGRQSSSTSTTSNYSINIYGGSIYVSVASGDTDAIDSNGSYKQTGGIVVSHNSSSSGTATALDTDGSASITGGVFIGLGKLETTPSVSGVTKKTVSLSLSSSNKYTLSYLSNDLISFKLLVNYSSFTVIGASGTYTLTTNSGSTQTFTI